MLVPHTMSGQTVGVLGLAVQAWRRSHPRSAGVTIFAHDDHKPDANLPNGTIMPWQDFMV